MYRKIDFLYIDFRVKPDELAHPSGCNYVKIDVNRTRYGAQNVVNNLSLKSQNHVKSPLKNHLKRQWPK